jgi:tetratricopeptide (TPR) repeat protein
MPSEMQAFIEQQTDLSALVRYGGDLEMLKNLIAAGFPVMIEKGYDPHDDDWMGHYLTLNGYDNALARFTAQDSLIMPDYPLPYEQVAQRWRDFNYVYLVIFPPKREAEVLSILGPQADRNSNYHYAADRAKKELGEQTGRDQYFAWFNLGTSRVGLGDHAGAAEAYDQAFALYPSIPEDERPWRVLWYEVGPYAAYYHTGRYQDVVNLANTTFFALGEYTLEESFYWRGLANEALGDHDTALFDLRKAVELNPNFTQAEEQLALLEDGSP